MSKSQSPSPPPTVERDPLDTPTNTAERRALWRVRTGLKAGFRTGQGPYFTGSVTVSDDG